MQKKAEIINSLVRNAGLQQSIDAIPNTNEQVMPIVDVSPFRPCNVVASASSTSTIYTTPTDRDFYLNACWVTAYELFAGGAGAVTIQCTPEGQASATLIQIQVYNAGAEGSHDSNSLSFPIPIKLKRGSGITLNVTATSGAGGINGFTDEVR